MPLPLSWTPPLWNKGAEEQVVRGATGGLSILATFLSISCSVLVAITTQSIRGIPSPRVRNIELCARMDAEVNRVVAVYVNKHAPEADKHVRMYIHRNTEELHVSLTARVMRKAREKQCNTGTLRKSI